MIECPYEKCEYKADALAVMELHQNIIHESTIIQFYENFIVVPLSK